MMIVDRIRNDLPDRKNQPHPWWGVSQDCRPIARICLASDANGSSHEDGSHGARNMAAGINGNG